MLKRAGSISGGMPSLLTNTARTISKAERSTTEAVLSSPATSPVIPKTRQSFFTAQGRIHKNPKEEVSNRRDSLGEMVVQPFSHDWPSSLTALKKEGFSLQKREFHSSPRSTEAAYRKTAEMFGEKGRLKNYDKAKVTSASYSLTWADAEYGFLPANVSKMLDLAAGQGGGAVYLARKYPDADILTVDDDPNSAKFIKEKICSGKGLGKETAIQDPSRVEAYEGVLAKAIEEGKCEEGSMELINADAFSPYLDDDQLKSELKEIRRALAVGGMLVITGYGEHHRFHKSVGNEGYLTLRTDRIMVDMLHKAGFEVIAVSNLLKKEGEEALEKTITDLHEMGSRGSGSMPPGVKEGEFYWHSIKFVAIKLPGDEFEEEL